MTSRARAFVSIAVLTALGPPPAAAAAAAASPRSWSQGTTTVRLFLLALGDEGRSGARIGCGDSLVAVERRIAATAAPLTAAFRELLQLRDSRYGQSGLYNALAQSHLDLARAAVTNGTAEIRLTGTLTLSGACDGPRVEAQLRELARQFPSVEDVSIFVNDVPLATVLSAR